jgi:hypothetical protein
VARYPSAISNTFVKFSHDIWAASLPEFARTQSRNFLTSLISDMYTGVLLCRSLGGKDLSTWAPGVPSGVPLIGQVTSPGAPREVRFSVVFIETVGTGGITGPLAVGLSGLLGIFGAARRVAKCPPAVVNTVASLSPLGYLISVELWRMFSHPTFLYSLLLSCPVFNGERCRGIHPSIRSFNWSPGHYPSIRRTHLIEAELPAAVRSFFIRGGFPLNRC